jgi:hypothetical protein
LLLVVSLNAPLGLDYPISTAIVLTVGLLVKNFEPSERSLIQFLSSVYSSCSKIVVTLEGGQVAIVKAPRHLA